MYPITVVDDFFSEPDKIVDYAMQQEFFPSENGRWPGKRSKFLWELDRTLYDDICVKIISLFHPELPERWDFEMQFQLISPYSEHQYDPKNRGWIHVDKGDTKFGGIIYLNKHPEKDTGTCIYKEKKGWSSQIYKCLEIKQKHYTGEEVSDEEYERWMYELNSQYEETMIIKNVYNRMALFNCNTWHGVQTFGKNQDRLTISFFCRDLPRLQPPYYR
tara:strand:- start:311 stop:961 length:651 start_codon:yes stop_codon:yes gene_type:complete